MSDNSTGSSGSSINSWTLLSPEEAAIDTAGPVDDGTESIGDVPSITEEVAESTFEVKPSESEAPQETVLSEEGHQVCQGTSPELFGEGAASGPSAEDDPEICAPVIHATFTTSPPDNDLLGAVPFSIATESSLFLSQEPFLEAYYEEACLIPEAVAEETPECVENIGPASKPTAEIGPAVQPLSDIRPASAPVAEISTASASVTEIFPVSEPIQEIGPASEPVTEIDPVVKPTIVIDPSLAPIAEMFPVPEPIDETDPALEPKCKISPSPELPRSSFPDVTADVLDISHTSAIPGLDIGPCPDISSSSLSSEITHSPAAESLFPETPASSVLEEKDLVTDGDEHKSTYVARQAEPVGTDEPIEHGGEDSGLRQRRVHYPEEPRQSSDEEDVEEMEFRLPERKEEKPGLSMNHLIIGALALLCLGAFLISGTFFDQAGDDFDGTELSDQELLEKLVEENKQISILEAQIQAQKEELDQALRAAAEKGITDKEHARMKEELSALPGLKEELQALKARVSELTQLTAGEGQSPAGPARLWGNNDELKRQKLLLEQSKTRLETMKKQDWPKKWLGERLVEMQQRLSDQVDHISKKDEWRRKQKGAETRKNDWSDGVQKHKEFLKKYRDEWEQTKPERKVERERRKQERSLQARSGHKQKHDHRADQLFESKDFWKLQEKKLRKKRNPPRHCQGMSGCADAEGLVHVKLSAFQGLLDTYLNKLQGLSAENKEAFHRLVGQFFHNGIFPHNKMLFSEFAKNVADILEDLADLLMDDDVVEEEMEEFEREVLWHFAI